MWGKKQQQNKNIEVLVTAALDAQLANKIALLHPEKHDAMGKITTPTNKTNFSVSVTMSLSLVVFSFIVFFASIPKFSTYMSTIRFIKTGIPNEIEDAIAM